MEIWKEALGSFFGSVPIAALVYYILWRKLEKFRTELQTQFFEYQTTFSYLYQKRADVIEELYWRLHKSTQRLRQLTNPSEISEGKLLSEKKEKTASICQDMNDYYNRYHVYLNPSICEKMDSLIKVMLTAFWQFDVGQKEKSLSSLWNKAWKQIDKDLPPLLKELEQDFRNLLEPQ